jgi:hypothetical protein
MLYLGEALQTRMRSYPAEPTSELSAIVLPEEDGQAHPPHSTADIDSISPCPGDSYILLRSPEDVVMLLPQELVRKETWERLQLPQGEAHNGILILSIHGRVGSVGLPYWSLGTEDKSRSSRMSVLQRPQAEILEVIAVCDVLKNVFPTALARPQSDVLTQRLQVVDS